MVNKDELINKLVEFLDIKLTNLSKDNQLINVFIRPIFSRIINNNIGKVNQALSIIAKDKIIESAIVNWFEDEDAGIEKVWNYFRAI